MGRERHVPVDRDSTVGPGACVATTRTLMAEAALGPARRLTAHTSTVKRVGHRARKIMADRCGLGFGPGASGGGSKCCRRQA